MKNLIKLSMMVLMSFSMSCSNEPITEVNNESLDFDKSSRSYNSSSDVINPINDFEVVGTSILHRKKNRVSVNFKTTDLTPGYAYTLWWVIWNKPENCAVPGACNDLDFGIAGAVEVEVLYATGLVVSNSGIGNFSASLDVDDASESVNMLFGIPSAGGLQIGNTNDAEIHVVVRSHGPVIPELVDEQIGGYLGGCTTFLGVFNEIPDEVGECGDIEFAVHSPVN